MRYMTVFAITIATIGCSHPSPPESAKKQGQLHMNDGESQTTIREKEILGIAKAQVEKNETWGDRAEYTLKKDETGWTVDVWRLPKVPGGVRYISIDDSGNVLKYVRGK